MSYVRPIEARMHLNASSSQPAGYSGGCCHGKAPMQSSYLGKMLAGSFNDELPDYDSYKKGFKEAYAFQRVYDMLDKSRQAAGREDIKYIDGVVRTLSEKAGYTDPKQITRLKNSSPYVRDLIDSVSVSSSKRGIFENIVNNSPAVDSLNRYRTAVQDYMKNDPFQQRLDNLLVRGNNNSTSSIDNIAALRDNDLSLQLKGSPLQAQLYASIDREVRKDQPIKDAFYEGRKTYLELVARKAGYEERKIKDMLGKEGSSTTVGRFYERAGLDFSAMKKEFERYMAMQTQEAQKKEERKAETREEPKKAEAKPAEQIEQNAVVQAMIDQQINELRIASRQKQRKAKKKNIDFKSEESDDMLLAA
jgi:hypothetical protein